MELKELKIERPCWGENQGKLVGEVKFKQANGNITLQLDEAMCKDILKICASAVIASAKEVAERLVMATIEATAEVKTIAMTEEEF